MPSPIEMAQAMELEEMCEVLRTNSDEDSYIDNIVNCGFDDFDEIYSQPVNDTIIIKYNIL